MSPPIWSPLFTKLRESQKGKKSVLLDHSEAPRLLTTWALYVPSLLEEYGLASGPIELYRRLVIPDDVGPCYFNIYTHASLPAWLKYHSYPQPTTQGWMLSPFPRDDIGSSATSRILGGFKLCKTGRNAFRGIKPRLSTARHVAREQHVKILDYNYTILLPRPYRYRIPKNAILQSSVANIWSFTINLPPTAMSIINRANPRDLIDRMLPVYVFPAGTRYIASCFWSWLCVLDGESLFVNLIKDFGVKYYLAAHSKHHRLHISPKMK